MVQPFFSFFLLACPLQARMLLPVHFPRFQKSSLDHHHHHYINPGGNSGPTTSSFVEVLFVVVLDDGVGSAGSIVEEEGGSGGRVGPIDADDAMSSSIVVAFVVAVSDAGGDSAGPTLGVLEDGGMAGPMDGLSTTAVFGVAGPIGPMGDGCRFCFFNGDSSVMSLMAGHFCCFRSSCSSWSCCCRYSIKDGIGCACGRRLWIMVIASSNVILRLLIEE